MSNIDRYAVVGEHVSHSRSPQIHVLFATATRQALQYGIIDVAADEFSTAADNEKLATARAQAVRDYLLETGIGRERMNVQPGKAEAGEGKSGAERAKLRRVELIPTQSDPVPIEYQDKDLPTEGPQG